LIDETRDRVREPSGSAAGSSGARGYALVIIFAAASVASNTLG
jgi:hypothetical protein